MDELFRHLAMDPGSLGAMIIKDDGCPFRYTIKIRNPDAGDGILQNTMELVRFRKNPEPIGVRALGGRVLSDISPAGH